MKELIGAFIAGKELSNSEVWKKRQVAISLIMSIVAFVLYAVKFLGYNFEISQEDQHAISEFFYVVVAMFGLFGAGATVATTKRIGVQSKTNPTGTRGDDGYSDNSASGRTTGEQQVSVDASRYSRDEARVSYLDENQRG